MTNFYHDLKLFHYCECMKDTSFHHVISSNYEEEESQCMLGSLLIMFFMRLNSFLLYIHPTHRLKSKDFQLDEL